MWQTIGHNILRSKENVPVVIFIGYLGVLGAWPAWDRGHGRRERSLALVYLPAVMMRTNQMIPKCRPAISTLASLGEVG